MLKVTSFMQSEFDYTTTEYISQQTTDYETMLDAYWPNVVDDGPTLAQHLVFAGIFILW